MAPLKRILLAEDNERDIELTLAALDEHNLANEVVTARDGAEALDYLYARGKFAGHANGLPVVVLLDLKMPRVDGLEVLRQMRNDPALKHVPVVMVTSSREEQDLVSSYQLGANAYVVKPVDFQKFVESVRELGFFWAVINEPPPGTLKRG
ncbi:MAG TPA: response regulator [Verrucomicrobiae bacterium]|jgi:CheY-like chemotaxis protein|nr:response regulator [Verrucomicrobiae bacterium]